MSSVKKNGGAISVYYSVILGIVGVVLSSSFYVNIAQKQMLLAFEKQSIRHLIYIEMIYYIRNEINDETYQRLIIDESEVFVSVNFNRKEKLATLLISYEGTQEAHTFWYDTDCLCIVTHGEKEQSEK